MTRCVVCHDEIEPAPRYFTDDGLPRHMLCLDGPVQEIEFEDSSSPCYACGERLGTEARAEVTYKNEQLGDDWWSHVIHDSCFDPEKMEIA